MIAILNGMINYQDKMAKNIYNNFIQIQKKKFFSLYIKSFKNPYSITVTSSFTKNSTFSSSTFLRSESNSSVSMSKTKQK